MYLVICFVFAFEVETVRDTVSIYFFAMQHAPLSLKLNELEIAMGSSINNVRALDESI